MTQEEQFILLQDLCARLPYGVKAFANTHKGNKIGKVITITTKFIDYSNVNATVGELYTDDECFWLDCKLFKPYFRPMSSMTEEERNEWADLFNLELDKLNSIDDENKAEELAPYYFGKSHQVSIDWLNSHHFDYRGLIEKGLALEAPEGMYK